MNRFTADYSSSINSTPGKEHPQQRSHLFSSKPPEHASTTPIAPPPSQIFGSSTFGTGVRKLQLSQPSKSSPPLHTSKFSPAESRTKNGTSAKLNARFPSSFNTSVASDTVEQDGDRYTEDDMDEGDPDETNQFPSPRGFQLVNQQSAASLMKFSPNNGRGSRISVLRQSLRTPRLSALPHKGDDSVVRNLAKELGARARRAPLTEPDEVILRTEQILRQLDEQAQDLKDGGRILQAVTEHVLELIKEWQRSVAADRPSLDSSDIGPQPSAPAFVKANYLASLLLALHHPPSPDHMVLSTPQILLDWLDTYHVSYEPLYRTVASAKPNCTSHELFWDAVQSLALRGKLQMVMQLFAEADFRYAASAADDGTDGAGYKGAQLQSVQSVIYRARVLLNSCPAIQSEDWDVAGPDWDLFRSQVKSELENLTELASGQDDDDTASFEAENFGLRKLGLNSLGKLGQKSGSTIPWTIFQNLKILYGILFGSVEEIAAQSQDWLEAATSLTIWWDGSADTSVAQWSFDVSRANDRAEDDNDIYPYLGRLRDSFLSVTDPNDKNSFQINAMSPIEVGLGSILQGSTQSALIVLRGLSQCVAAAVAEVGVKAGWLEEDPPARPAGLSEEDLMVLSYGAPKQDITKDELLLGYAEQLFEKETLRLSDGSLFEGWEVAISVITRLDDRDAMHTAVGNFIEQLQVVTQERAEKLTNLCSDLGLQDEARKVSDRFGDHLVNNTTEYGTALLCYARSHASHKIRQLVDLLISYSLVQSRAYPPDTEMDDGLQSLVGNPRTALADIADVDPEAAEMLQFYLVGYACLRRFYNLRDEDNAPTSWAKSNLRPLARSRAAAKALIAAINSAADSIYGGLYDPERQSAIQVDGLLTLFGEATALLAVNGTSGKRVLTTEQMYSLLAAIEDLSTVSSRVYDATEECLQAALRNFHGSQPPSPQAMLKKSMSSGTNSSFSFSMMGSEMLGRSEITSMGTGGKSVGSSGVLVPHGKGDAARGWDWRSKFKDRHVSGRDVVRVLRMGLAEELSLAELEGSV
ncbi:uncharacterized protein Z518_05415 [Rhinocladiella mackenziei CBS 650.93]|uniref:Nuclear pore complex protein Nup85 n=1 Tax=Rhinocladiella mackenziei CBS 650.93 TaxID=1442369 RepID=A0A0D2J687_9EURO|nr:uncharacterized protein Z518_05415 [Rhinocladiella mackenziei CBS 650.93]KIX04545.1 hypothetical protein Z518_05415 [Rhinocladiella mackenziei CBS 650.93]